MSDRLVLVRVTDPDVKVLYVEEQGHTQTPRAIQRIPVSENDQLLQDIQALSEWAEATYRQAIPGAHEQMLRPYVESARRLRAAAGLDTEDEL